MKKLFDHITDSVALLSSITLAFLVLLIVYDALMRYIFQSGSIALQELEWHLFDVVILLSIAYTLKENAHVRVDIFFDNFSNKYKKLIDIFTTLFFILPFSLLIIYFSYDFVLMSFTQMEASSNPGGLEYRYLVKSLMPLAFVFVILQAISKLISDVKELKS